MKHVFSNPSDIASLWVDQLQDNARTPQGHFSFKGTRIYSYRTIIGEVLKKGKRTLIVLNKTSYSRTTTPHQAAVRHACFNKPTVTCPDHTPTGGWDSLEASMRLTCWWRRFANLVIFLSQTKPESKEAKRLLREIDILTQDMSIFAKFMGYSVNKWRLPSLRWEIILE